MPKVLLFMLWALAALAAAVLLLLLAALVRTLLQKPQRSTYEPSPEPERERKYGELLARMVRFDTTSCEGEPRLEVFEGFHALLRELFPRVWAELEVTDIDGNLLFHWPGLASDRPLVLMSHQDVVPAEGKWRFPPFSGTIAEGKVWGRGTSDTKCSVMAFFQAVEELLAEGVKPPQDVYLVSSCTEEWSGDGGPKLAAELERRGVRPFLLVDEGGGIIREPIGGIPGNFAMVGVFEKGKADVRFTAKSRGGHSSAPPLRSPLARLAAFINKMEKRPPFRQQFSREVKAMFARLAPYAVFGMRYVLGNLWLFAPLLKKVFPRLSPQAAAMLRTTVAFTMAKGSDAPNVLPQEASVTANLRYAPHQAEAESLAILRREAAKFDLSFEVLRSADCSRPADIEGAAFRKVEAVIAETFPGLPISPYVLTVATDARNFEGICDSCLRFSPVIFGPEQLKGMHGIDENIELRALPGAVDFYKNLVRQMGN